MYHDVYSGKHLTLYSMVKKFLGEKPAIPLKTIIIIKIFPNKRENNIAKQNFKISGIFEFLILNFYFFKLYMIYF